MILLDAFSIALAAFALAAIALYQVSELGKRVKALESRKPEQEKRVVAAVVPVREWEKPIDNFTPKKPETLRPNQVRGMEVDEREFEFDVPL